MKKCAKCGIVSSNYSPHKRAKDGIQSRCKGCKKVEIDSFHKTKKGIVSKFYYQQRANSIKRGHIPPSYSIQELREWVFKQKDFELLYTNWVNSGYETMKKPSIDRLDDSIGYAFDNIQLITWQENKDKGHRDMREGKITNNTNPQKRVIQKKMNGDVIAEFVSANDASRKTGITQPHISRVCNGFGKTAHGFLWEFKD